MYFLTLIRCAYLPHIWRHTFSLYDSSGHPKRGDNVLCDLAGPLCFQGDYLAKEVLSITDMWPTATRWSFQTRVLQTYLPYTTREPIRWRCIASENIFLFIFVSNCVFTKKKSIRRKHQRLTFCPGSIPSERAPSMATGKGKTRSWSWFATREGKPWKSALTSGGLLNQTFCSVFFMTFIMWNILLGWFESHREGTYFEFW